MPELPQSQNERFTGAVVLFFLVSYFALVIGALCYVFTHL